MSKTATYIGPTEHLRGKLAIIRTATHGCVVAQFEDKSLTLQADQTVEVQVDDGPWHDKSLGFGWHAFPESHFELIPESKS